MRFLIWLLLTYLFGPFKDALRGQHFASDQEVKGAVDVWLVTQPKTFFVREYRSLYCWTKHVEKDCVIVSYIK
jgi:hypothetical protein